MEFAPRELWLEGLNLFLRPADDQVWPIVHLEEAAGRLYVMQEEHREAVIKLRALQSSATRV
jgi:hypothetical protein